MPSKSKKHKSTMITVEQLVDLALGNPEVGSVNFNVLHALLHVIIQQMNIQGCLVEFKGSDSERMEGLVMTAKPGPILKLTEYMIDLTDGKPINMAKEGPQSLHPPTESPRKMRNALFKHEAGICPSNGDDMTDDEKIKIGRDNGAPPEKKKKPSPKDETNTAEEKHDEGKEEEEIPMERPGSKKAVVTTEMDDKKNESDKQDEGDRKKSDDDKIVFDKKGEDTEPESEKESLKLKKLAKRKKREEEEASAAALEEKTEVQKVESKKTGEETGRKTRLCPCKEQYITKDQLNAARDQSIPPEEKLRRTSSSHYGSESEACQTVVRVEAIGERCDTWRSRPALAPESLVKLEEKVTLLQDAFEALEKMPSNEELMKRTCGPDPCSSTPVKDMWQLYNLNKRVESCEGAVEKLATMIEDIVKETCNFREAMMVIADAIDSLECNQENCSKMPEQSHRGQQIPLSNTPVVGGKQAVIASPVAAMNPIGAFAQASSPRAKSDEMQVAEVQADQATEDEYERPRQMSIQPEGKPISAIGSDFFKLNSGEKFRVLKEAIECLLCQFRSFTDLIPLDQLAVKLCSIVTMQKRLDNLQKEWETFLQSFSSEGVPGAVDYIKALRLEIEVINDNVGRIVENRKQLEITTQSITQEISQLQAKKADKETMEDLLAEKADASVVNKKVSHDQFDAACDDLTKGLDEALEKLIAQEAMWNEAMEDLQRDLESKLDKVEIMPLKEFINKKLMSLHEKLKQLAQLRKDAEAAGVKSRILRNLNCIACDNDVIMRMDNKSTLQHPTLTSHRSMRPYIAYELDQVRKALKKGPTCRPTTHIEAMAAEVQRKNIGLPLSREGVETKINKLEHYCNRYCGGSHTITTPQQRVTRIGHFLTEFGPHAVAMFNQENVTLPECKPVETGSIPIPQKDIKLL